MPKLEGSFNDSFSKYTLDRPLMKNRSGVQEKSQDHSIVDKLSEKFRINEEGEDYGEL